MNTTIIELKEFLRLTKELRRRILKSSLIKYKKRKLIYCNGDCMLEYKLEEKLFKKACLIDVKSLSFYLKNYKFFDIENIKYKGDYSIEEYPEIKCKKKKFYELEGINNSIKQMMPFISKDETRYYLTGIYFDKNKLVATNGHILVKNETDCKFDGCFILPTEVCKLISKLKDDVKFCFYKYKDKGHSNVIFKNKKVKIISKTIDGVYPNYEKVINYEDTNDKMSIEVKNYVFMKRKTTIDFDKNNIEIKNQQTFKFLINHKMKGRYEALYIRNILEVAGSNKIKELVFNYNGSSYGGIVPLTARINKITMVICQQCN